MEIPRIPLAEIINAALDFLIRHIAFLTKAVSEVTENGIKALVDVLMFIPPAALIALFALAGWRLAGRRVGIFIVLGLGFIWSLELWLPAMQTLALVIISTLIAVVVGMPVGVFAALFRGVYRVVMPILDFMQTMPAFVYLIPAIPFFGLGMVSAMFSTVIFAMPPAIRLTTLGIRQVPLDLIEAADAYGSTRVQKLFKLQLPMATPTIMAGINQTIMLALSMVVIAAMIGAKGLGGEVWRAIQRLEPGAGFEAGLAVVILAMILDRITQKIGARRVPGQ